MTAAEYRAWRQARGWSQRETAEQLGISQRLAWYYEEGDREIPKHIALALAELARRHKAKA